MSAEVPELSARPGVARAAFFDLERTLTPHAVEQTCALEFRRRGKLSWAHLARVLAIYARYNLGLIGDFDAMKRSGAHIFEGRELAPLVQEARGFFNERLTHELYPAALAVVARLREQAVPIYLVSSTYRFLVEPYAEKLGAAGSYGVDLELVSGRCTGALTGAIPYGEGKAAAVREIAAREKLDLAECLAFGDSMGDAQMLAAVGHPYAVNPARGLRRRAAQRGWPVLTWRMTAG